MQYIKGWVKIGAGLLSAMAMAFGATAAEHAPAKPAAAKKSHAAAKKPAAAKSAKSAKSAPAQRAAAVPPDPSGPFEIQVWHALNPEEAGEFDSLVQRFNEQGHGFTVKVVASPSQQELISQGLAAVRAKRPPHLIEISDNHSPEFIAQHGAILPLYELLAKYPIRDLRWFLPQTTASMRDAKGNLLALPWMTEIPIYLYNRDLYQKAGLNPDAPPRTWREMQTHLVALQQSGVSCPYATSDQSWIHIENLAALHNVALATKNNGLDGSGALLMTNDLLHVRHLALMMSWVRSTLFPVRSAGDQADLQFASGDCAVLTSGSSALATVQAKAHFSYGVAPLPYYDEEASRPSNPFVGGSSFWALGGHSVAEQKAVAQFIAYLASPVVAAEWHQKTGFLPLTEAAFRASDVSYYKNLPGAEAVISAMSNPPGKFTRGFRLSHYDAVSRILDEELDDVWSGRKPPKQGLDDAVARANALIAPPAAARK
ncbi:extracellular solute-binding protein [Pigmentiphaga soli]|uniref:sn-glycerol-3-phosphate-binding periplasmic protein UgpB n=1 Tax=Pigmentiphaga soli TaxID=1007095 RepID=A0ABP8GEH4_9BURK